jgi:hypothetical protein
MTLKKMLKPLTKRWPWLDGRVFPEDYNWTSTVTLVNGVQATAVHDNRKEAGALALLSARAESQRLRGNLSHHLEAAGARWVRP